MWYRNRTLGGAGESEVPGRKLEYLGRNHQAGKPACPTTKMGLQMEVSGIVLRSWAPVYAHLHGFTTKHLVVVLGQWCFKESSIQRVSWA